MAVAQHLSVIALRQVVGGAMQAVGLDSPGEAVVKFLTDRFTDHSQKLTKAIQTANERAWKAMEVALAGESLWDRCKLMFARAEDQAFREQVRAFLDVSPLTKVKEEHRPVLRLALQELQSARKRGALLAGCLGAADLASQAGAFARFADPQAVIDAEWQAVSQVATLLRESAPNLYRVLVARTSNEQRPSLLALAVRYHFRRQVETDEELFRGLAFANLQAIKETQDLGFAALTEALAKQGQRLENLLDEVLGKLGEIDDTTKEINERMKGLEQQIQKLLEQLHMQNREVRPSDSLSVRGEAEQQKIQQVVAEYRNLPEEDRRQRPELLNEVGKLEIASGDFEAAQRDFEAVATLAADPKTQAEAHHNAYRAALERRQWADALDALLKAASLDPERFAPFPLAKYLPQRILGAGGFGVVFLCQHKKMSKPVVVKTLLAVELDREVAKVFTEATALEDLEHPGIIGVKDCDFADEAGTRPYLVMDYFEGSNLADHVAAHGPLSHEDLLAVARPVAEALRAAHERGILHRDVKPANVLIRRDAAGWKVKLIDFGLALRPGALSAKASTQGHQARTAMGRSIAGTVRYAAPEQMGDDPGVEVGSYSDVYGFGRTCYYALFRTPEPDDDEKETLPADWRRLLRQCTKRQANTRLPDFAAVLAQLTQVPATGTKVPVDPEREAEGPDAGPAEPETDEPPSEGADEPADGDEDTITLPDGGVLIGGNLAVTDQPGGTPGPDPLAEGIACLGRGEYAQAARAFTQALRRSPDSTDAYRRRAQAYLGRGSIDKALADLDQLIKLEPKVPANRLERGRVHASRGSHDKAIADFNQAILNGGTAEAHAARARSYAAKKFWDHAFADFDVAVQLAPANAETFYWRGEARLGQSALDQALADFTEASRLCPDDARYLNARGLVLLRLGRGDDALAEFMKAAQRDPRCVQTYLNRARVWLERGQNEQAATDLTHALQVDPKCAEAVALRAQARSRLRQFSWALSDFNKAIRLIPRDPALFVGRGQVQHEQGNYEEAIKDFQSAIKHDRNSAAAYLGRGKAYCESGYYGSAITDLTRALELAPAHPEALLIRAAAHYLKRKYDEAISDASEVIRLDPASAQAYFIRGCAQREKKASALAIADLTESIRLKPQDPDAHDARGLAYYLSGDHEQAVADFSAAIKLEGKNAEYYRHRARAYDKKGDRAKGREDQAKAASLTPATSGSGEPNPTQQAAEGGDGADIGVALPDEDEVMPAKTAGAPRLPLPQARILQALLPVAGNRPSLSHTELAQRINVSSISGTVSVAMGGRSDSPHPGLLDAGFVTKAKGEDDENVYQITNEGIAAIENYLKEHGELPPPRDPKLAVNLRYQKEV